MQYVLSAFLLASLPTLGVARGAEPTALLTENGKELLREEFAAATVPATFRTLRTPDSFRIVEGALELASRPGQDNATHGAFPVQAHDLTVAFRMKFVKAGTLYVGIDGYKEEYQGNTHLVRFSLSPTLIAWDQKRGGPESKHAVSEAAKAARAAKQPIPKPTAEQLADPTFFRTEELTSRPIECTVGEWHHVLLEISGNELVAQVDGKTVAATSTVADSKKNRIGLGWTGRGTALVDDVRIWENSRRADWERVKARLSAETESAK